MDNTYTNNTDYATGTNAYSDETSRERGRRDIAESTARVKDRVTSQVVGMKEKINEQAKNYGGQLTQKLDTARSKTSAGLKTTSQRINNLAMYMEEHDTRDMSQTMMRNTQETIRRNPGKSILTGLLIGVVLGRMLSMGGGRR